MNPSMKSMEHEKIKSFFLHELKRKQRAQLKIELEGTSRQEKLRVPLKILTLELKI